MTTIASSTTSPVASVNPNNVIVLIVKPNTLITANVPTSEIGSVTAGISVERGFCRKRKMTRTTSTIEKISVKTTSLIDSLTNCVTSNATS